MCAIGEAALSMRCQPLGVLRAPGSGSVVCRLDTLDRSRTRSCKSMMHIIRPKVAMLSSHGIDLPIFIVHRPRFEYSFYTCHGMMGKFLLVSIPSL